MEALRPMGAFLETFCTSEGVARPQLLRLNLVIEELFTNTVRHGYRGDCDEPVWVTLEASPGSVRVTYEDTAPPFNPYAHLKLKSPDSTLERFKVGGLGVLLTNELAAARDYAYVFGRNRIRLTLERSAPDAH
jgi:anti-sigma regulatory factor (Ser/Thr protein kinase)